MASRKIFKIIGLSCGLLLNCASVVQAEMVSQLNSDYLLEDESQYPLIKFRCIDSDRNSSIRGQKRRIKERILTSPNQNRVIIEIERNCRDVNIFVDDYRDYTDIQEYRNNDWLTRPGSGWDWYLRHR